MKSLKLSIIIFTIIALTNSYSMQNGQNQALKKAIIATYCGTLIAEATLLLPQFQSLIFGNKSVQESTLQALNAYTQDHSIPLPNTYEAHSFWHSCIGSIFTNHGTLYIDTSVDMHNQETIKSLQKNLTMIQAHRDRNIFIAALVIPAIVYGTLGLSSWMLTKINPEDKSFLGKIKNGITILTQNFTATSLITLLSIYSFIKAQDYYLN